MGFMRVGNYSFRPALLLTLLAACIVATTAGLGFWQLQRAEQKQRLQHLYAEQSQLPPIPLTDQTVLDGQNLALRRVEATGQYDGARFLLLDNQTHRGMVGYRVLSLLRLSGARALLVDRGWIPQGRSRALLPPVETSSAPAQARGLLFKPSVSPLARAGMAGEGWPKVVQTVELDKLEALFGTQLHPYLLRLDPDAEQGFVRDPQENAWLRPTTHTAYAVQWFLLALVAVVVYVGLGIQRQPLIGDPP